MTLSRISFALAAALLLSGTPNAGEGISEPRAAELRREAIAHAYLGASLILECLSDAKRNQSSNLRSAKTALTRSKQTYDVLARETLNNRL